MTEKDRILISDFEGKLHRLVHLYTQQIERNKELTRKIEEKENTLKDLEMRCAALENSYNNLKQAKMLSLSEAGIDAAKERITRLVREIDRCIESSKKQPE